MSQTLGPVRQVGYVVRDIERAIAGWLRLGVGPWFLNLDAVSSEFRYYGQPSASPRLAIAMANSGDLQVELVQQFDDARSLYADTLSRNGEGAQHLAYWTADDFDGYVGQLRLAGFVEGHGGRMGANRGRYGYFVNPELPSAMIEVSELTGGKAEYFDQVKQAARHWDGRDPVRHIARPR